MSSSLVGRDDINEGGLPVSRNSFSASVVTLIDSDGMDELDSSTNDTSDKISPSQVNHLIGDSQSEKIESIETLDLGPPTEKDGTILLSRITDKARDFPSKNDDDDITSKAAVALAAVAAAATANNKSPAEAAREARDLAHTFIAQATTVSDDKNGNLITRNPGAFESGTSSTSSSRNLQTLTQITLSDVKSQSQRRTKETASPRSLEDFCKSYNDTFLKHLLLIEYYQCADESLGNEKITTTSSDSNANDVVSTSSQACDRLEAVLRRVEGAYDSLIDRLPAQSRNYQRKAYDTSSQNDGCDTFDDAIVVPDLLPPCISEKGDLTVAFFRACIGESINQPDIHRHAVATYVGDSTQPTSCGGNVAITPSPSSSVDLVPPLSPGKTGSVFSSLFKSRTNTKGFSMFRKSKNAISDGKSDTTVVYPHGSSTPDNSRESLLRPGEYVVKIEREMLGLTVENVLERTVVRTIVPNGPAKKAGARVGSLIVKVGTVETKNLTHFETIDELRQSNRPLQLVMRPISDVALQSAREEMGRLIKGYGFGMIAEGKRNSSDNSQSADEGENQQHSSRPLIEADLRTHSYTNLIRRRFAEVTPNFRSKKDEALAKAGEKLIWILTLLVVGLEREATFLNRLTDESSFPENIEVMSNESSIAARRFNSNAHQHTAKNYSDAARSISKVLFDFTRKKLDTETFRTVNLNAGVVDGKSNVVQLPSPLVGRNNRGPRRNTWTPGKPSSNDLSVAHETPLLQIGDVLQRTRTFLADPTSSPAALLRGEVISFLCDVLDLDTEMELSEEEAVSSTVGPRAGAGVMNDLGSAGSLLKLIVLNCPIMRSPCCEEACKRQGNSIRLDDDDLSKRIRSDPIISTSDMHRQHAGNRFLAIVHRLAASRSTGARIAACSLAPVLWGHLDFPYQLQLRGVITRALHDVEVIVRRSTATVLHEIAELVFDVRSVPWLVLMCERAMTDPEPHLRSAAMTLTWHLAEHLPNAFLGDARQGSRYLRRLPNRDDPLFADVYLLQCKLLPVATRLAEDRSPSVRLAVASQCDRLCDALGYHWSSVIIDVLLGLLSDTDERVRCEAVLCVPRLSEIVLQSSSATTSSASEVSILEALLPAATKLQNDLCVSVRVALATAAGELLTLLVAMARHSAEGTFQLGSEEQHHDERKSDQDASKKYKLQVDERLIPMVQALLNDIDPEVTSAALRAVSNATRSSVLNSRSRHMSIASNDDDASFASSHSHGRRVEEPVFLPVLSENQVLRLLPTLTELSDSRQWRVRQSAVEIVPALLGCTSSLVTRSEISKLCVRLMADQVDAVRKTAAECLCMGGSSLGSHGEDAGGEWISTIVFPTIRNCAVDPLSKTRLLCLKMIEVILLNGVCPGKWYGDHREHQQNSPTSELVSIALSLATDRIANVRLNVGRTLESVAHIFDEQEIIIIKNGLHAQIQFEMERHGGGDIDVIFFANRCLRQIDFIMKERVEEQSE
jgi:PDZ domain